MNIAEKTEPAAGWNWQTTYLDLPEGFSEPTEAASAPEPRGVLLNDALATDLGLNPVALRGDVGAAVLTGQALPPGATPVAQAYAGHQFGGFTMLGDGRALLLGEHVTPDGERFDIAFKGSGPTAYARRGDGLATLGPMLREYVMSEAMHALGVPTTRSLAVASTGVPVRRVDLLPGAVLTRIAASQRALRHVSVCRPGAGSRRGAGAGGSRDRPALPRSPGRRAAAPGNV